MRLRRVAHSDHGLALAAFSSGRYADYLAGRGLPAPAWAWVNTVARGSTLLVASLAMADVPGEAPEELRCWYRARKAMSQVVMEQLAQHQHRIPLAELQRRALVGLELELAATADAFPRGPVETTCLVVDALVAIEMLG